SNPSLDCDRFFQADHWNAILRSVDAENSFSKLTKDEVLACRSALVAKGIDLAAYNTAENAADIDDLRKALGIEKWVLYGVSYGTRLALEVMDQHPEGVMASILDSVLPLDINYRDEDGPNLDRSMTILERDCLKSQNCMPDLKGALKTISKQLDKQPVLLRSHDNEPRYRYVSGADFIDLVFGLFYDREGIEMLPALIESTFKQDFRPLAEMVFEGEDGGVSQGMDYSITCSESARPDLTRMRSQYWASWVEADDYNWACPLWLVEKAPIARLRPHALIIPTLLLAGEYDPATPSHWAFHAAKNLPHGQVVVFRGIGHDVIDSDPCGSEVVADFLADPNRKVKTGCIDKMEAPRFAVGAEGLSEIGDGATRD
ncbi:alpha/beta hydrolase, partial [Mesorhizobium sp.]|uniref:alpha/beta hydrolase n=1 Tax=Mesorhizobium sp. TaxID=1871066 RepID=UPI0025C371DD